MRRFHRPARRGVAAVEMAFVVMLFVIPVLFGIWEVGRFVQIQQIVSNAAREGARIAAQGYTINTSGAPTQIKVSTGATNVKDVVYDYLHGAGLTNLQPSDVTVTFAFTTARTTDYVPISLDPPGTSYPAGTMPPEPCYGEKGQMFVVSVSIPWNKVRWIDVGLMPVDQVRFTVTWQMLLDERFTVNEQLPTW
ncbi:MAG: pilus assembly protein [Planctomycetia bacterium]|nr:pilus assembly protein [Planctomycetia bacterium]